jgi:hypothetical protein
MWSNRPSIVQLVNPFELMYNNELAGLSTQSLMVHQTVPASPSSVLNGASLSGVSPPHVRPHSVVFL